MPPTLEHKPLGQLLVSRGVVAREHVEIALEQQRRGPRRKRLGQILIDARLCSDQQVAEALAEACGVPFARLTPKLADPGVMSLLPREFLERERVLPLALVEGVLTVAVTEPANVALLQEIGRLTGHKAKVVVTTPADIAAILQARPPIEASDVKPVGEWLRACIEAGLAAGATEIHVEPTAGGTRVRFRIHGSLIEAPRPTHGHPLVVTQIKKMAGIPALPQGGAAQGLIRFSHDGRQLELRVTCATVLHGERLLIRVADAGKPPARLEKLGFGYDALKHWRRLVHAGGGLLLVVGRAGSGKRTTLHSTVAEFDATALNVCTVEPGTEQPPEGVNQFCAEATDDAAVAAVLRAALSQEPDVVMLHELAGPDVARLAATTAAGGRRVIAGVHAEDAAAAVTRLLYLGVPPYVLASALRGVVTQTLVRRLCGACKEPYDPSASETRQLEKLADPSPVTALYRGVGCARCNGTGYTGHIGLFEVTLPNEASTEAVIRCAPTSELRRLLEPLTKRLRSDGADKVKAGITTLAEVVAAVG